MDGHDVTGFDLDDIVDCPPTVTGDVQQPWPFASADFDIIVMGEILEHLVQDFAALTEARRVLRPDGALIGTVPYLHDSVEYHVRVHTPASIRRLVQAAGFNIEQYLERPGIVSLSLFNYLNHLVAFTYFVLTRRSLYGAITRIYGTIEWHLGKNLKVPRRTLSGLGLAPWGGIFLAKISDAPKDFVSINRTSFCSNLAH
jgi:SAM-dependent methyltransferase